MPQVLEIPIFPLGTVLFPGGRLPLRIFEQRYVDMTKACIRDDSVFGVCLIRAGYEVGKPAVPCELGCTARIAEWNVPGPGLFTLDTRGETRFRILNRWVERDGLMRARVELIEPAAPQALPERFRLLGQLLGSLMEEMGPEHFPDPRPEDAGWVGSRLAELLPVTPERKQGLLELDDPLALLAAIERELKEVH
ncbi:LON peptidase substrate-binding domain-containing protein [Solimonas sp. SE-A11]|uniref:LON peptidase substrate-binding domain-containing protein n=1 Tax=Solimonas sp. SE-A11 TaxID=3054954 RepID=UPI00259CF1DD|nr:LON peptidase substrate-binding domain-containing protein [Solimonas sp. SE-A11]MDM4769224.1 LON peptidase substrate-binding domain-containing protein [Solimonas sp. SE-A11]